MSTAQAQVSHGRGGMFFFSFLIYVFFLLFLVSRVGVAVAVAGWDILEKHCSVVACMLQTVDRAQPCIIT